MDQIMLDIETMAVDNTKSLILSVGAVRFSLPKAGPLVDPDPFHEGIDAAEQLLMGRLVGRHTQKWWGEQSMKANSLLMKITRRTVSEFGLVFTEWFQRKPCNEIWANGVMFDLGNVGDILNGPIWKYNAVRDARTIYQLPKLRGAPSNPHAVAHDALSDCLTQVSRLWEHTPEEMLVP